MLNLPQLVRRTDSLRKKRAKFVKILYTKKGYNTLGQGFIATSSYSTHLIDPDGRVYKNEEPNRYVTVVTFLDNKLNVKVSCSCDDFKYREEWALWNRKAADIEYSNGDFPDMTNPQYRPYVCKHILALWEKRLAGKIKGL